MVDILKPRYTRLLRADQFSEFGLIEASLLSQCNDLGRHPGIEKILGIGIPIVFILKLPVQRPTGFVCV